MGSNKVFNSGGNKPSSLSELFIDRDAHATYTVWLAQNFLKEKDYKHITYYGQRGIGKTTLISKTCNDLLKSQKDGDQTGFDSYIVWTKEEEPEIDSYFGLLQVMVKCIGSHYTSLRFDKVLHDAKEKGLGKDEAEAVLQERIFELASLHGLILIVENIDYYLDKFSKDDLKKFVGLLEYNNDGDRKIFFIGTAVFIPNFLEKDKRLFNELFSIKELRPFTADESLLFLRKLAQKNKAQETLEQLKNSQGKGMVLAVDALLKGVPRYYSFFSDVLFATPDSEKNLVSLFIKLLDTLTPMQMERVSRLTSQQQKVISLLAEHRSGVSVSEVAKETWTSIQAASKTLRELYRMGYLSFHILGKEALYEIRDVLLRMSLEDKSARGAYGRTKKDESITAIIQLLKIWYKNTSFQKNLATVHSVREIDEAVVKLSAKEIESSNSIEKMDFVEQARCFVRTNRTCSGEDGKKIKELKKITVSLIPIQCIYRFHQIPQDKWKTQILDVIKQTLGSNSNNSKDIESILFGMVKSLPSLLSCNEVEKKKAWIATWREIEHEYGVLSAAIRIQTAGLEFSISRDKRELYSLPLEERNLLMEILTTANIDYT